jgi:hypothetical protein
MQVRRYIVAMRGRNPDNPSDRRKGIHLEQKLEVNTQGLCNTLTSVHKDNLVLEIRREGVHRLFERLMNRICVFAKILLELSQQTAVVQSTTTEC